MTSDKSSSLSLVSMSRLRVHSFWAYSKAKINWFFKMHNFELTAMGYLLCLNFDVAQLSVPQMDCVNRWGIHVEYVPGKWQKRYIQ